MCAGNLISVIPGRAEGANPAYCAGSKRVEVNAMYTSRQGFSAIGLLWGLGFRINFVSPLRVEDKIVRNDAD
jgi:hypothetical protein